MDKEPATVILALVTVLAVSVVIQPILPPSSGVQHYSELGLLGPDRTIGGYPKSVVAGQPFLLYAYVGNHEGAATYYQLLVKVGDQTTHISNTTYARGPSLSSYSSILSDDQNSTFPMQLALGRAGRDTKLIFELWSLNTTSSEFVYTGLWTQLLLNVTSK